MSGIKIYYSGPLVKGDVLKENYALCGFLNTNYIKCKVKTPMIGNYKVIIDDDHVQGELVVGKRWLGAVLHPPHNFYVKGELNAVNNSAENLKKVTNVISMIMKYLPDSTAKKLS